MDFKALSTPLQEATSPPLHADFPGIASSAPWFNPEGPFIERPREEAQITQFLLQDAGGKGRIGMIWGPAGAGKSALVARALAGMGGRRRTSLLIEGIRPLLPQVAGWLFAQGATGDEEQANPQDDIWVPMVAALEQVGGWLILDHVDQVPDVAPQGAIQPASELGMLLRALALSATKGRILLLCEEPLDLHLLGIPDNSVVPVPIAPLTFSEALTLMAQMPHLSDGLSLAQTGSLFAQGVRTPRQILRLESLARIRGTGAPPPDANGEESVLELLYDALPPAQQALLRRLSVYHHPLPRSFVEAQWTDRQEDLPHSLQVLISASLLDVLHVDLTSGSTELCYVLSNKIRDWAESKLRKAEGEQGWMAASNRGAAMFESCASWIQHDPGSVMFELPRLLRQAQEHRKLAELALGAAGQFVALGLLVFARPLAEIAVQFFKKDDNEDRYHGLTRALLLRSKLSEQAGDIEAARLSLQDAMAEAQAAADSEGTALILNALGTLDVGQGRYHEAQRSYEEAMAIARRRSDDRTLAGAMNNLARVAQLQGRRKDAASLYAQSSEIYEKIGDQVGVALTMINQATMERDQGNYPRALELAQRSLEIYRRREQSGGIALSWLNLAVTSSQAGDLPAARGLFHQSLQLFRKQEDLPHIAEGLVSLADLEYRCENYESAKALLDEAQPLAERLRARRLQASILFQRARLGLERVHTEDATAHLQDAVMLLREIGERDLLATSLYILGVQASKREQPAVARAFLEEALALRRQESHPRELLQVVEMLADLLAEQGDLIYARPLYTEAVALCKQMGDPAATSRCLHSLGSLEQQAGQTDAALAAFAESEQLCRQLEDRALLSSNLTAMGSLAHQRGELQQARVLAEEAALLGSEADDGDAELNALLLLVDVLEDAGQGAELAPHLPRIFALQRWLGLIEVEEHDGDHGTGVEAEDDGAPLLTLPGQIADPAPRFDPRMFTVRELLTLMENDELRLDEDLPRLDRWDSRARSLLIESLLLGVPLPPLYLSAEHDGKLTVLDGHQRLSCLRGFLSPPGRKPGGFALGGLSVLASDNGKRFGELDPLKQRRLQQAQIPAHVLDSQTPLEIKRDVLRRLGTGAVPLRVQELLHLTSGPRARDFLRRCAGSPTFEEATCGDLRGHPHLADQEVVLRFCAFRLLGPVEAAQDKDLCVPQLMLQTIDKMNGANLSDRELEALAADLERALGNARDLFGEHAFRRWPLGDDSPHPINRALFESWAVALAEHEPAALAPRKAGIIHRARLRMLSDRRYARSISGEMEAADQVRYRFAVAAEILRGGT
jgi:tetratricopeptide (TPR) repeat protein